MAPGLAHGDADARPVVREYGPLVGSRQDGDDASEPRSGAEEREEVGGEADAAVVGYCRDVVEAFGGGCGVE